MSPAAIEPRLRLQATPDFRGHIPELDALRAFGLTMVILAICGLATTIKSGA